MQISLIYRLRNVRYTLRSEHFHQNTVGHSGNLKLTSSKNVDSRITVCSRAQLFVSPYANGRLCGAGQASDVRRPSHAQRRLKPLVLHDSPTTPSSLHTHTGPQSQRRVSLPTHFPCRNGNLFREHTWASASAANGRKPNISNIKIKFPSLMFVSNSCPKTLLKKAFRYPSLLHIHQYLHQTPFTYQRHRSTTMPYGPIARRRRAVSPLYEGYDSLAAYNPYALPFRSPSPLYGYGHGYVGYGDIEMPNSVEQATRAHAAAQAECEKAKEKFDEAKKKFEECEKKVQVAEDALRAAKYFGM